MDRQEVSQSVEVNVQSTSSTGAGQAPVEPEGVPAPEATTEDPGGELLEELIDPAVEIEQLKGQAQEYLALAQRTQADFENFRKRMAAQVGAAEARGIGRLTKELLPALDNLERALAAAEADEQQHHLTEGIRLVQAELLAALSRSGVEGFSPAGEPFDPAQHEAMAQHAVEGAAPGTIVEVLQSGYRLADTILRPARVVVAG